MHDDFPDFLIRTIDLNLVGDHLSETVHELERYSIMRFLQYRQLL